jgi:hypothetical protein
MREQLMSGDVAARKATKGYDHSRRCASRSRCTTADASGSTNRPCRSQLRRLRLKLTTTAHVVLFAVTRRDSGASPAGRPGARLASFAKRSRFLPESVCEIQWVRHVALMAGSPLRLMGFAFAQPIP